MPKVLNKHKDIIPKEAIYCGRGSPYGNPHVIGVHGTRDEVIDLYIKEKGNDAAFIELVKKNLKNKDLVCFCAPKRCHGDWLLKIANE